MRHPRQAVLEGFAILLLPTVVLGFFAVLLHHALGTIPALIDALTGVPLWAQVYLALAVSLAVGVPTVVLAGTGERLRELDRIGARPSRRDLP